VRVVRGGDHLVVTKLDQGIDTATRPGTMFFQILGAVAEFEAA
jgi:DNA invertase Pin-like site-specific DNA recombinase